MVEPFASGNVFPDEDSVKNLLKEYNETRYTNFTVTTNNKKSLLVKCKHGRKRNYEGSGKRPKQRYNFIGCNAMINMYKSQKDGRLKVTKSDLIHNHPCTKTNYDAKNTEIDQSDQELILTLNSATARPSQIKRVLKQQTGKTLSTKKIQNLIRKLSPSECDDKVSFEEFLKDVEDNGGIVDWKSDPDGTVSALFITTKTQKSALLLSQPTVLQLDTSFGIDQAHYKLTAFCYLNPVTNKTEVAALALVSQESNENFDFVLALLNIP